ncbi:MAG TPA: ornithine cyclodeaminase family protein [Steroidobacteraceae bacterium]|nr:ornithine cyclodeaminase family protein [Steroidobacteraceae bacterium]
MIALSATDVLSLLTPGETVALVEAAALAAAGSSDWVVPQRQHVKWAQGTLLVMPAMAAGATAVKLVSVVPGNAGRKLPVTNGLMIVGDATTGLPVAVMDAAALTAMRTGAVGALGLKYIAPAGVDSVGIVGTGVQGAWQAITACAVRPIRTVFALRRSAAVFERFRAALASHAPAVTVVACATPAELLSRTQVIVTATTSAQPVLPDDAALLGGRHFIAIGSYERHMCELPDAIFRLAGHLVLDSEFARHEVGEAVRAVEHGALRDADLFTIGELAAGRRSVDVTGTTAYKSAGMALYDLYVAQALYQAARRLGVGQEFAL